jgi:hypothetical protein
LLDDDDAEHTMSDLPVLMEIEWPSLAGGCWERPRGARFFLSLIVWFSLPFLLVGKYWGLVCGMRDTLCVRLGQPLAMPSKGSIFLGV